MAVVARAEYESTRRAYSKFLVYGSPHMSSYRFNQFSVRPEDNNDDNDDDDDDDDDGAEAKYKREISPINFYWQAMMSRMGKHNVAKIQQ
uniref:Uncharacterized protein n=1 Tax=Plectus sambesii TaxID=2011161 RepID=A0A914VPF2_9BILA